MKIKKIFFSLLCLLSIFCVSTIALTSCKTQKKDPVVETFSVIFVSNGGSSVPKIENVSNGSKIDKPTDPIRNGYEFDGWYRDTNFSTPWRFELDTVTGNLTLYAKWKLIQDNKEYFTVTIDLNDGSEPKTIQVEKNHKITGVETPSRPGYTFKGWAVNGTAFDIETDTVTSNITLVAQWEAKVDCWTVTIDLNDGSSPKTIEVEKGQKITGVEIPSRSGYTFKGWTANGTAFDIETDTVTSNITLVAQWEANKEYFTVTIDLNNGIPSRTVQVEKGQKITGVGTPNRSGYTFKGWTVNGTAFDMEADIVTSNITLVAQWASNIQYISVTIDLNDGSEPKTIQVEKGQKITGVETPSRSGYTFKGWTVNGTAFDMEADTVTSNITLVAQWEAKVDCWTVTIDLNDGSTPRVIQVEKGQKITGVETPSRPGYTFKGWTVNGTAFDIETDTVTSNITLVAQWASNIQYISVTIDLNDGSTPRVIRVEKGQKITGIANPTRPSYIFKEWTLDGKTFDINSEIIITPITLVAQWTLKEEYEKTDFDRFVEKNNILYASDFTGILEEILDKNSPNYVQTNKTWIGEITNQLLFNEKNSLKVKDERLALMDSSNESTQAYLYLDPLYSSVIELEAVINFSSDLADWDFFTVLSPFSDYLIQLRMNENKNIVYKTKRYDVASQTFIENELLSSVLTFNANTDIKLHMTLDLNNARGTIQITQDKVETRFNVEFDDTAKNYDMPLSVCGIQFATPISQSRDICIDWIGIRLASEDFQSLKNFYQSRLDNLYELYQTGYTQSISLINQTYTQAKVDLDEATTFEHLKEIYLSLEKNWSQLKSDEEIELEKYKEDKLIELEQLKIEQQAFYTIEKASADDQFANKEAFIELFSLTQAAIQNALRKSDINDAFSSINQDLLNLPKDEEVLQLLKNDVTEQLNQYIITTGTYEYHSFEVETIQFNFSSDLNGFLNKAGILSLFTAACEQIDAIENDQKVLDQAIESACLELENYEKETINSIDPVEQAELLELLSEAKATGKNQIRNVDLALGIVQALETVEKNLTDAKADVTRLLQSMNKSLEELQTSGRTSLKEYMEQTIANYDAVKDTNLINEIKAVYQNTYDEEKQINTWIELNSAKEIEAYLQSKKTEIDNLVKNDTLQKKINEAILELREYNLSLKQSLSSSTLEVQMDEEEAKQESILSGVSEVGQIASTLDAAKKSLDDKYLELTNVYLTVTFSNCPGSVQVQYGKPLNVYQIHIPTKQVIGIKYNNEEITSSNPLIVYEDIEVELILADLEGEVTTESSWFADLNSNSMITMGRFIENPLFSISQDAVFSYYEAIEGTYPNSYLKAWRSATMNGTSQDKGVVIEVYEDLEFLKLNLGFADSLWSEKRSGIIHFVSDNEEILTIDTASSSNLYYEEVILPNLKYGDRITMTISDLTDSSRVFLFAAEAKMDLSTVEKSVSILWKGLEQLNHYYYFDKIDCPIEIPNGYGVFKGWYYLDTDGVTHLPFVKGMSFPSNSEITMYPEFIPANITIHYVIDTETITKYYDLGAGDVGVTPLEDPVASEGKYFDGWYQSGATSAFDFSAVTPTTEMQVITLEAHFNQIPSNWQTIGFDPEHVKDVTDINSTTSYDPYGILNLRISDSTAKPNQTMNNVTYIDVGSKKLGTSENTVFIDLTKYAGKATIDVWQYNTEKPLSDIYLSTSNNDMQKDIYKQKNPDGSTVEAKVSAKKFELAHFQIEVECGRIYYIGCKPLTNLAGVTIHLDLLNTAS